MRHAIYKWELSEVGERVHIEMPKGSLIMTVQSQMQPVPADHPREFVVMWVLTPLPNGVDEQEMETRTFYGLATGMDGERLAREDTYLGTVQMLGGSFVMHYFEKDHA